MILQVVIPIEDGMNGPPYTGVGRVKKVQLVQGVPKLKVILQIDIVLPMDKKLR